MALQRGAAISGGACARPSAAHATSMRTAAPAGRQRASTELSDADASYSMACQPVPNAHSTLNTPAWALCSMHRGATGGAGGPPRTPLTRSAMQVQQRSLPGDAEDLGTFWERVGSAYELAAETAQAGATTCIVAHAAVHSALICRCLGLAPRDIGKFRMSTAGVTVIEFPFDGSNGVIRCVFGARIEVDTYHHQYTCIRSDGETELAGRIRNNAAHNSHGHVAQLSRDLCVWYTAIISCEQTACYKLMCASVMCTVRGIPWPCACLVQAFPRF